MQATLFRGMRGIKKKFKKGKKDSDSLSTGGYPKVSFDENSAGTEENEEEEEQDSDDAESFYAEVMYIHVCLNIWRNLSLSGHL